MVADIIAVLLTAAERDDVEWAFGAMCDYWGAECVPNSRPGSYIADPEGVVENELTVPADALMPYLDGDRLILSTWDEINDDLLFRLEEQLPNMADNAKSIGGKFTPQMAGRVMARCARLAEKIRAAINAA